jgi:hypothetical protein
MPQISKAAVLPLCLPRLVPLLMPCQAQHLPQVWILPHLQLLLLQLPLHPRHRAPVGARPLAHAIENTGT